MSELKEYISNITIPDGSTKYVKDAELTETVNELSTKVSTIETNVSNNSEQIGENSSDIKTAKSDITTLKSEVDAIIDKIYPVGSIYLAMNSTNPSTLFGGTWERIKDRFLLACGDTYANGSTGGEATHTLVGEEIPYHDHSVRLTWANDAAYGQLFTETTSSHLVVDKEGETTGGYGGNAPHNNMPPYVTCYMWQRTA